MRGGVDERTDELVQIILHSSIAFDLGLHDTHFGIIARGMQNMNMNTLLQIYAHYVCTLTMHNL